MGKLTALITLALTSLVLALVMPKEIAGFRLPWELFFWFFFIVGFIPAMIVGSLANRSQRKAEEKAADRDYLRKLVEDMNTGENTTINIDARQVHYNSENKPGTGFVEDNHRR